MGITAVQVRRDLMLIGFSSDTKKGYDVEVLIDFISQILDARNVVNIGVIGMGNLGQALTKYFNGQRSKLRIVASFDIDPAKVGHRIDDIPCYDMARFEEQVNELDIKSSFFPARPPYSEIARSRLSTPASKECSISPPCR